MTGRNSLTGQTNSFFFLSLSVCVCVCMCVCVELDSPSMCVCVCTSCLMCIPATPVCSWSGHSALWTACWRLSVIAQHCYRSHNTTILTLILLCSDVVGRSTSRCSAQTGICQGLSLFCVLWFWQPRTLVPIHFRSPFRISVPCIPVTGPWPLWTTLPRSHDT